MVEDEAEVDVVVHRLLVRQLDPEADREPAAFAAAAIRRLHHARPAAGDDGPARLGEEAPRLARELERPRPLRRSRRAEAGDRRAIDPLDRLEPGEELAPDRLRALTEVLEAVMRLEEVAVLHHSIPLWRVASSPPTSAAAMSPYRTAISMACSRSGGTASTGTPFS